MSKIHGSDDDDDDVDDGDDNDYGSKWLLLFHLCNATSQLSMTALRTSSFNHN